MQKLLKMKTLLTIFIWVSVGHMLMATAVGPIMESRGTSTTKVNTAMRTYTNNATVGLGPDESARITPDMVAERLFKVDTATGPVAVCESYINLPLDDSGQAFLTADMVDDGSWGSCGIASLTIDQTDFDCNSAAQVFVELTVTDSAGMSTSCWTEVNILGVPTASLTCVDERIIGISDGETVTLDPEDMTEMGSLACWDLSLSLTDIDGNPIVNDEITYAHAGDTLIAIVSDNNSTLTCWSYIIVFGIDCSTFDICDTEPWNTPVGDCSSGHTYTDFVEWPDDITVTTCYYSPDYLRDFTTVGANNAHPQILGDCDYIAVAYQDEVFTVVPVGDLKIIRKWTVVDFNEPLEIWYYNQELIIHLIDCASNVNVNNFAGVPVPDVNIYSDVFTADDGIAVIDDPSHNYFTPTLETEAFMEGLDLHDVLMIQEHILGLRSLNDFQLIAADVNKDAVIDIRDVLDMKRYIIGSSAPPPFADWEFIGSAYDEFQRELSEPIAAGDYYGGDVQVSGLKRGDLNGDANAYAQANDIVSLEGVDLFVTDQLLNRGEIYEVDIYAEDIEQIAGQRLEFYFNFGAMNLMEVTSTVIPGFNENSYEIDKTNNKISIQWIGENDFLLNGGLEIERSIPLFKIKLNAADNGILSQEFDLYNLPTSTMARINDNRRFVISLEWVDRIYSPVNEIFSELTVMEIVPNPASGLVRFSISNELEKEYTLKVFDSMGKLVFSETVSQEFEIDTKNMGNGMYHIIAVDESGYTLSGQLSVIH